LSKNSLKTVLLRLSLALIYLLNVFQELYERHTMKFMEDSGDDSTNGILQDRKDVGDVPYKQPFSFICLWIIH
jgi:hypothetical protein